MCQGLNILIRLASLLAWSFCSGVQWHSSFPWDLRPTLNPIQLTKGNHSAVSSPGDFLKNLLDPDFLFLDLCLMVFLPVWRGKVRLGLVLSHWTLWLRTAQIRLVRCILMTWWFGSWLLPAGGQSFPSLYLEQSLFQWNNSLLPGLCHHLCFHCCLLMLHSVWSST